MHKNIAVLSHKQPNILFKITKMIKQKIINPNQCRCYVSAIILFSLCIQKKYKIKKNIIKNKHKHKFVFCIDI